jgi:beta-phosphoglucomutase
MKPYQIMWQGVIFDFDGVIADTERDKFRVVRQALKKYKQELKAEDLKDFIGKRTSFFLREKFSELSESNIEQVIAYRRAKQQGYVSKNKLIPGIKELLVFLKNKQYKIAIATGSEYDFVKRILKINNLSSHVDVIVSGNDYIQSKPHPACIEVALKKMGLGKDNVIVVEDSVSGILSAKSAGCKVLALTTYLEKDDLSQADLVFSNHFELLEYIKEKDL